MSRRVWEIIGAVLFSAAFFWPTGPHHAHMTCVDSVTHLEEVCP